MKCCSKAKRVCSFKVDSLERNNMCLEQTLLAVDNFTEVKVGIVREHNVLLENRVNKDDL